MRIGRVRVIGFFLLFIGVQAVAQPRQDLACTPVAGLETLLKPGTIVLLGEMHGTRESPRFLADAVCGALTEGLSVTVGLEFPVSETAFLGAYMQSPGDVAAERRLLQGEFWQRAYQDGRASQAMLGLLRDLRLHRTAGLPLRVVYLDDPTIPSKRDSAMSARLQAAVTPSTDVVLVLTGNLHNRVARGVRWDASYEPMGYLLRQALPGRTVISLNVAHEGGEAWVCFGGSPSDCGVRQLGGSTREGDGIELFDETAGGPYDGRYHVGRLTASLPAAQSLEGN